MRNYFDEIFKLETAEYWQRESPVSQNGVENYSSALLYNRKSADQLGWGSYRSDIILKLLGLNAAPDEVAFAAAIAQWQRGHKLSPDGKIGPDTWRVMKQLLGLSPSGTPAVGACLSSAMVSHQEAMPPLQTFYACINLGIQSVAPLTGIYIPTSFSAENQFELIVYLRGHSSHNNITTYWKQAKFLLREALAQSNRNCILVAPTLGPKSQAGGLDQPGGFDRFIAAVMTVLSNKGIIRAGTNVGRIILACHSGGGKPMMNIAGLNDAHSQLIKECWGFDCMYSFARSDRRKVADFWNDWARKKRGKLYVYYHHTTAHNSKILACLTMGLPNVYVQSSANMGGDTHNKLVLPYWKQRLDNMPALPFDYKAARCKNNELEFELSPEKLSDAVAYNKRKAANVGWADYFDDIIANILKLNYTPVDWLFADHIAEWQSTNNLTPDGKLGPDAWAKMKVMLASWNKPVPPTQHIAPGDTTKFLAFLGYDLSNNNFETVLKAFQADMPLKKTGKLDSQTTEKLRALQQQMQSANLKSSPIRRLSRFRLTNYYVTNENDYAVNPVVPVLDDAGNVLARVNPRFFISMSIEGTGRLRDGRLLNVTGKRRNVSHLVDYGEVLAAAQGTRLTITNTAIEKTGVRLINGKVDSVLAFKIVTAAKMGKGYGTTRGMALDPFFTLAADLGAYASSDSRFCKRGGLVPAGTKVFILEYAGRKLPDGRVHDGWFTVNDTGGAIFGAHFDVFTGSKQWGDQLWKPHIGHVWFDMSEQRCPPDYGYGLTDKKINSPNCYRQKND